MIATMSEDALKQSHQLLNGASIFITGGTGSFGNAFVDHITKHVQPKKLIIFSRDELKQYEMAQRFPESKFPFVRYFIGDVRDLERLNHAMRGIDYVIHAAAMKQVPTAEYNPFECIKTNILGAQNVINAAIGNKVKRVIALSTDKAANPINLYGATKLASDKLFVAGNHMSGEGGPRFSVVRYGNVVGSRGSVIPLFQRLIREGATTIPVTDPRMTRFWITLNQGVNFLVSCLSRMQGGEVFVPKIPSMNMLDLARSLKPDCEINVVGIRSGEKLHEVMVPRDEARNTLEYENHFVIQPSFPWWQESQYKERTGGKSVGDNFEYSSETNTQQLSTGELQDILYTLGK
jgi:UDP-N-acetylglucosamine 4,6-dehydratase